MNTKFFVTQAGLYIGGFSGVEPPPGSVEIPFPPSSASLVWNGSQFIKPLSVIKYEELKAKRKSDADSVASDSLIQALLEMTPIQASAYIEINTSNMNELRDFVKKLSMIVFVLANKDN